MKNGAIRPLNGDRERLRFFLFCAMLIAIANLGAQSVDPADLSDIPADKRAFFYKRSTRDATIDPRITSRIASVPTEIRSYAVIISISEYPKFKKRDDRHLGPASEDLVNLLRFLERQAFDEIIVLRDGQATRQGIEYVLDNYLKDNLKVYRGGRVLIAYTGHGADDALVLSDAGDADDNENLYPLTELERQLKDLAERSFQLVALINACNSGGLFTASVHSGGDDFDPSGHGAHAVTASKADELAYGLPNTPGSIFFNAIIDGVNSGRADYPCAGWTVRPDGSEFPSGVGSFG